MASSRERTGVSALVITLNEEENIRQCLESVTWADEIVVVDALSEDRTVEISRRFTDKVFLNPWPGFAAQRNFGLERATGDWILVLDADERVTPEVRDQILACIARAGRAGVVAYQIPRRNYFFGRWLRWGGAFPDLQWRLFKRGFIRYDETTLDSPIVGGASAIMRVPLDHFTGRTIQERLRTLDVETTFAAERTMTKHRRIGWADVTLRPARTFVSTYLRKQGFRDGLHGLVYATLVSFDTFVRYVKAWDRLGGAEPRGPDPYRDHAAGFHHVGRGGTSTRSEKRVAPKDEESPELTLVVSQERMTCEVERVDRIVVSAVIITLNEARHLGPCLDSLRWVDEIVVVDSGSTDRTRDLAKQAGARVLFKEWPGYGAQKNFGFDQARGEWVLIVDADERVSGDLAEEILAPVRRHRQSAPTP